MRQSKKLTRVQHSTQRPAVRRAESHLVAMRLEAARPTRPDDGGEKFSARFKLTPNRIRFHEASHAVLNIVLGIAFGWVVALDDDGWVDATNPAHDESTSVVRLRWTRRWVVSLLAGAAGEEELGEGVAPWYRDFDNAEAALEQEDLRPRYLVTPEDDRELARLRSQARALVREYWPQIEAVAEALLRLRALTAQEVAIIVAGGRAPRK